MRLFKTYLSAIIILISCNAQETKRDKSLIDNWKSYSILKKQDSPEKANSLNIEWRVFKNENIIKVEPYNTKQIDSTLKVTINLEKGGKTELSYFKTDNGYLVGFFHGKWGGSLEWYTNGGKSHYKISDDEIVQFISRYGEIFAIQGLAHLSISEGSIIKIEKRNGKYFSREYLKLPSAPAVIELDKGNNFYVVTSKSLLEINAYSNISTIIDKGIWYNRFNPNSIVIQNSFIYIGMRGGVFKYNLLTKKQEWLLPD